MTHHLRNRVLSQYAVCITQSGKGLQIVRPWRNHITFDRQTITMFGVTVFSEKMIIISSLYIFEKKFSYGHTCTSVSVTRDDAD